MKKFFKLANSWVSASKFLHVCSDEFYNIECMVILII